MIDIRIRVENEFVEKEFNMIHQVSIGDISLALSEIKVIEQILINKYNESEPDVKVEK
jgi:hypothetical protein